MFISSFSLRNVFCKHRADWEKFIRSNINSSRFILVLCIFQFILLLAIVLSVREFNSSKSILSRLLYLFIVYVDLFSCKFNFILVFVL